jgi:hypothetical protein
MIEAAGDGAKDLVTETANNILFDSKKYVPTDTFTLYNSGYVRVVEKNAIYASPKIGGVKSYTFFEGTVGYGDNDAAGGPNPRTGYYSSTYAWKVHEDLSVKHPHGQAKFLERAYREYMAGEFGSEMVNLERCIYLAKRYTPVMRYGIRSRTFTGKWERKRRNERTIDTKTNLDRLADIYKATRR